MSCTYKCQRRFWNICANHKIAVFGKYLITLYHYKLPHDIYIYTVYIYDHPIVMYIFMSFLLNVSKDCTFFPPKKPLKDWVNPTVREDSCYNLSGFPTPNPSIPLCGEGITRCAWEVVFLPSQTKPKGCYDPIFSTSQVFIDMFCSKEKNQILIFYDVFSGVQSKHRFFSY